MEEGVGIIFSYFLADDSHPDISARRPMLTATAAYSAGWPPRRARARSSQRARPIGPLVNW